MIFRIGESQVSEARPGAPKVHQPSVGDLERFRGGRNAAPGRAKLAPGARRRLHEDVCIGGVSDDVMDITATMQWSLLFFRSWDWNGINGIVDAVLLGMHFLSKDPWDESTENSIGHADVRQPRN